MKRKIVWEKYEDPLEVDTKELPPQKNENDEYNDEYELPQIQSTKILSTPFGFLPLSEKQFASKQFDFWVLHTNFNITSKIIRKIEQICGVETLDILTRYRVRIGFPKLGGLFNSQSIKLNIQKVILEFDYKNNIIINSILNSKFNNSIVNFVNEAIFKASSFVILSMIYLYLRKTVTAFLQIFLYRQYSSMHYQ